MQKLTTVIILTYIGDFPPNSQWSDYTIHKIRYHEQKLHQKAYYKIEIHSNKSLQVATPSTCIDKQMTEEQVNEVILIYLLNHILF